MMYTDGVDESREHSPYEEHLMQLIEPPATPSIIVIAAHPDDIESWCAGTLALAVDRGATVRLLLVTSGEHGTDDPTLSPPQVAARREAEAQTAANLLGITEVVFLHYPDGAVENTHALRGELVAWMRRWKPEVLFTHDPEQPFPPYLAHRDHRSVGRATLDAIYPLARDPLAFAEQRQQGLFPHAVREAWLFASQFPSVCVDISASFERKIAARLAHASQTPDPQALPAAWQERARMIGAPAGVALGEAFTVVTVS
jgi:LmbE family N-acetylglucosaminyl deacetylase